MRYFFISFLLFVSMSGYAQTLDAQEVLAKSIAYHDPDSQLANGDYLFHFEESRPDGSTSVSKIRMSPVKELFELNYTRKGTDIYYKVNKGEVSIAANGSTDLSEEVIKENRLSEERGVMMKNYYLYLWHLPMKLNDPGTILHDQVKMSIFDSHEALEIKVSYEESVGKDIWYFYFHPISYRMIGYRFYHDESANDGEYILLADEVQVDNIKLPAVRKWFTHKEDKFLGTDTLVKIDTSKE